MMTGSETTRKQSDIVQIQRQQSSCLCDWVMWWLFTVNCCVLLITDNELGHLPNPNELFQMHNELKIFYSIFVMSNNILNIETFSKQKQHRHKHIKNRSAQGHFPTDIHIISWDWHVFHYEIIFSLRYICGDENGWSAENTYLLRLNK